VRRLALPHAQLPADRRARPRLPPRGRADVPAHRAERRPAAPGARVRGGAAEDRRGAGGRERRGVVETCRGAATTRTPGSASSAGCSPTTIR
jgi:hypothetical protein